MVANRCVTSAVRAPTRAAAAAASKPAGGEPKLLRHQILLPARSLFDRAAQRLDGLRQRRTVPLPRDDAGLAEDEHLFGVAGQRANERIDAGSRVRRDRENPPPGRV